MPAYGEKLDSLKENSGLDEAVITGVGTIGGIRCAIAVWDTRFLMGSMGTVAGEKLTRAFERAQRERLPIVGVCLLRRGPHAGRAGLPYADGQNIRQQ